VFLTTKKLTEEIEQIAKRMVNAQGSLVDNSSRTTTSSISAFTRREAGCPTEDDRPYHDQEKINSQKIVDCWKSLCIYETGKVRFVSAETRS
jgi:hypothetical protein